MWHLDLATLIEGLDEWSRTDENIARLVDREDYWLSAEYARWTLDPDDPDAQRERAERKRRGIKPPPTPILIPVAARPEHIHLALVEHTQQQITAHDSTRTTAPGEVAHRKMSLREFQRLRGK